MKYICKVESAKHFTQKTAPKLMDVLGRFPVTRVLFIHSVCGRFFVIVIHKYNLLQKHVWLFQQLWKHTFVKENYNSYL